MQNIKRKILQRLIWEIDQPRAIDIFLYICQFQNDAGQVSDIYYRDVIEALSCDGREMCKQSFYNAIYSLEENGFVKLGGKHGLYDIEIVGNHIHNSAEAYEGYMSLECKFFFKPEFINLSINEKRLALQITLNQGIPDKVTMRRMPLKVSMDTLRTYANGMKEEDVLKCLDKLKVHFDISNKGQIYYISLKNTDRGYKDTTLYKFINHSVVGMCKKYKIEYTESSMYDTYYLFKTQYKKYNSILTNLLITAFNYRSLQPALINSLTNKKC